MSWNRSTCIHFIGFKTKNWFCFRYCLPRKVMKWFFIEWPVIEQISNLDWQLNKIIMLLNELIDVHSKPQFDAFYSIQQSFNFSWWDSNDFITFFSRCRFSSLSQHHNLISFQCEFIAVCFSVLVIGSVCQVTQEESTER